MKGEKLSLPTCHLSLIPIGEPEKTEVHDGVFETRRLLWLPILTAAALFLLRNSAAQTLQTTPKTSEIEWEAYLKEYLPTAKK